MSEIKTAGEKTLVDILYKYKDVRPKEFGDYMERCYPVSAVINIVQEYKSQSLPVQEIPQWYTKDDIYDWLIHEKYSKEIAEELSEKWAASNQSAFKKGWEKATNDKTGTFYYRYLNNNEVVYKWVKYPENKPDKQDEYIVNRRGEIKKIVYVIPNSPINEMWDGVIQWLKPVPQSLPISNVEEIIINSLFDNKETDKPYLVVGRKSYSRNELAEEIKNKTEIGKSVVKNIMDLILEKLPNKNNKGVEGIEEAAKFYFENHVFSDNPIVNMNLKIKAKNYFKAGAEWYASLKNNNVEEVTELQKMTNDRNCLWEANESLLAERNDLQDRLNNVEEAAEKIGFTRNQDKNGNNVFEGDIVSSAGGREKYKVLWNKAGYKLQSINNPLRLISLYPHIKRQIIIKQSKTNQNEN